jgi:choline dehydrogenase-like flavoprotein
MRSAIKTILQFVSAPAWKGYILGPFTDLAEALYGSSSDSGGDLDQLLDTYIQNTGSASGHAVGTASMSPKDANWGVVDPDLMLKGVEGLRVVDASVLVSIRTMSSRTRILIFNAKCLFAALHTKWTYSSSCLYCGRTSS